MVTSYFSMISSKLSISVVVAAGFVPFVILFCCFWGQDLSSGWPRACHVKEVGLELTETVLLFPPEYQA